MNVLGETVVGKVGTDTPEDQQLTRRTLGLLQRKGRVDGLPGGCDIHLMNRAPKPHTWVWTALFGLFLSAVYLANGREIGSDDTMPTRWLTYALLRGDGPYLDRFRLGWDLP